MANKPTPEALNKEEEAESLALASVAEQEAKGAISHTVETVAKAALSETAQGPATIEAILTATKQAILDDAMAAAAQTNGAITRAREAGYEKHIKGLAAIYSASKTTADYAEADMTIEDQQALRQWPIQGHSGDEWSERIGSQLQWDAEGIVAQVALGAVQADKMPAQIATLEQAHMRRVREMVVNAYLAGTQAAAAEWFAAFRGG